MAKARKTVTIFLSWQSDLDQDLTTRAIRGVLCAHAL